MPAVRFTMSCQDEKMTLNFGQVSAKSASGSTAGPHSFYSFSILGKETLIISKNSSRVWHIYYEDLLLVGFILKEAVRFNMF